MIIFQCSLHFSPFISYSIFTPFPNCIAKQNKRLLQLFFENRFSSPEMYLCAWLFPVVKALWVGSSPSFPLYFFLLVCVFSFFFLFTYHPLNCKWGGKMQALLLLAWVQIPTSCLFECAEWLTFCVLILILERQMTGAHFLEVFPRAKKKKKAQLDSLFMKKKTVRQQYFIFVPANRCLPLYGTLCRQEAEKALGNSSERNWPWTCWNAAVVIWHSELAIGFRWEIEIWYQQFRKDLSIHAAH